MAYTVTNFRTKKALKEAVNNYLNNHDGVKSSFSAQRAYNPGLGPDLAGFTGKICLEGPHYPEPHRWYAEAELANGVVVKVK